jgi:hypothetical protein
MSEAQVLVMAGTAILLLIALVGWFAQHNYLRVEASVTALTKKLDDFKLEVAKECINSDRLTAALAPISERLTEIKADQRRLFERMDGKQDKPGARD